MTRRRLRKLVNRWGNVVDFAALAHVTPRTVYRWLDGSRRISPMAEALLHILADRTPHRVSGREEPQASAGPQRSGA